MAWIACEHTCKPHMTCLPKSCASSATVSRWCSMRRIWASTDCLCRGRVPVRSAAHCTVWGAGRRAGRKIFTCWISNTPHRVRSRQAGSVLEVGVAGVFPCGLASLKVEIVEVACGCSAACHASSLEVQGLSSSTEHTDSVTVVGRARAGCCLTPCKASIDGVTGTPALVQTWDCDALHICTLAYMQAMHPCAASEMIYV